jgi:hypothetical protein
MEIDFRGHLSAGSQFVLNTYDLQENTYDLQENSRSSCVVNRYL